MSEAARDIINEMDELVDASEDTLTAWYVKNTGELDRLGAWKAKAKQLERENAELLAALAEAKKRMEAIRDYPKEGDSRRDEDGYPLEIVYDEFAYHRMVDSYREVASDYLAALRALDQKEVGK